MKSHAPLICLTLLLAACVPAPHLSRPQTMPSPVAKPLQTPRPTQTAVPSLPVQQPAPSAPGQPAQTPTPQPGTLAASETASPLPSASPLRHSGGGGGGRRSSSTPPEITSLSVSSGAVGDSVIISGDHFSGVSSVSFNGTAIPFMVASDNSLLIEVPGGVGDGPISISNEDGTATSASFDISNRVWFVDDSAAGNNDGSSWTHAHPDLQTALANAASGDEIWVAAGTYRPHASNRDISFQLRTGIDLYGGFAASETLRSQRNWNTNISKLSGDLSQNDNYDDGSTTDLNDNSRHVLLGSSDVLLDGFTIEGGYAYTGTGGGAIESDEGGLRLNQMLLTHNYSSLGGGAILVYGALHITETSFRDNATLVSQTTGGAIECYECDLSLSEVVFESNAVAPGNGTGLGGAVFVYNGSLDLADVSFEDNSAALGASNGSGGAIYAEGATGTLSRVSFTGNSASDGGSPGNGGALYLLDSALTIEDADFSENLAGSTAVGNGGAIYLQGGSLSLNDASFSANVADESGGGGKGGAIYADAGALTLNQTTFSENWTSSTAGQGGAIYLKDADDLSWTDVSFDGNYNGGSGSRGGALYNESAERLTITRGSFSNNYAGNGTDGDGGAIYNLGADLSLLESSFDNNTACPTGSGCSGGAIDQRAARLRIEDTSFTSNLSGGGTDDDGGALHNTGSDARLERVSFRNNAGCPTGASCSGGAINQLGDGFEIRDSVFSGNSTGCGIDCHGGAVHNQGANTRFERVVFADNQACDDESLCTGGGLNQAGNQLVLLNAVFVNNLASTAGDGYGGGLYVASGLTDLTASQVSFFNNLATGGGASLYLASSLSLSDAIVWDDSIASPLLVNAGTLSLNRSIVKGLSGLTVTGSNNLDQDPSFADSGNPAGDDQSFATADDGLMLAADSPAIGLASGSTTATDILGNSRDASPDAGAYEYLTP